MDLDIAVCGNALATLYSFRLICHSHFPVMEFNSTCGGPPAIVLHTPGHYKGVSLDNTPLPTSLIHRTFLKRFRTDGKRYKRNHTCLYLGTIQTYNETTKLFRVTYEDDDCEDLDLQELLVLDFTCPLPPTDWSLLRPRSLQIEAEDTINIIKGITRHIVTTPSPDSPPTLSGSDTCKQYHNITTAQQRARLTSKHRMHSRQRSSTRSRSSATRSKTTHHTGSQSGSTQNTNASSAITTDATLTLLEQQRMRTTHLHDPLTSPLHTHVDVRIPTPDTTSLVRGRLPS